MRGAAAGAKETIPIEDFYLQAKDGEGAPTQEPGNRLCRASGFGVASSAIGDVRAIANERSDPAEVSIHIFGTNIGGLM